MTPTRPTKAALAAVAASLLFASCGTIDQALERPAPQATAAKQAAEVAVPESGESRGSDPFAGMTDAEVDALSDEEFFAMIDDAEGALVDGDEGDPGGDHDDHGDHGDHGDEFGEDEEPAASFEVDGNDLDTEGAEATDEQIRQAQDIWKRFAELIPADQRQMVVRFELMDSDYGGAHVYPDEQDPTKWVLGVSADLGDDRDYVLVHEFGHLLTLQASQVPPDETGDADCPTYHTGEGCALKGSTMARFVAEFWPPERLAEFERLLQSEDEDALSGFYEKHADEFVTDYASTNPGEDIAETFAVFVTEDRPEGDTIADRKVQMLWDDPDLVELRSQIRSAMR